MGRLTLILTKWSFLLSSLPPLCALLPRPPTPRSTRRRALTRRALLARTMVTSPPTSASAPLLPATSSLSTAPPTEPAERVRFPGLFLHWPRPRCLHQDRHLHPCRRWRIRRVDLRFWRSRL